MTSTRDTWDCAHATQTPPNDLRELRVAANDIDLWAIPEDLSLYSRYSRRAACTEQDDGLRYHDMSE
jgi:hypothetical protein